MDTKTSVAFVISKDKKPSIKITGDVTLKELAIDDEKNNPLFRLPRLDVSIASAEPLLKDLSSFTNSDPIPRAESRAESGGCAQRRITFS